MLFFCGQVWIVSGFVGRRPGHIGACSEPSGRQPFDARVTSRVHRRVAAHMFQIGTRVHEYTFTTFTCSNNRLLSLPQNIEHVSVCSRHHANSRASLKSVNLVILFVLVGGGLTSVCARAMQRPRIQAYGRVSICAYVHLMRLWPAIKGVL